MRLAPLAEALVVAVTGAAPLVEAAAIMLSAGLKVSGIETPEPLTVMLVAVPVRTWLLNASNGVTE